jgi:hypothetical protein
VQPGSVFTATAWVKGQGGVELAVVGLADGKVVSWNLGGDACRAVLEWQPLSAEAHVPEGCDEVYLGSSAGGRAIC